MASEVSVFLVGQRRIGKSSILAQLRHLESSHNNKLLVVGLHGDMMYSHHGELGQILYRRLYREIEYQFNSQGMRISKLDHRKPVDEWQIIKVLEQVRDQGFKVLLLFDDFDIAFRGNDPSVAMVIRSMISQGHMVAAFAASLWPEHMEMFSDQNAPWYNVFSLVKGIGNFTVEEGKELLSVLSHRSGKEFSEQEIDTIINIVGTQPYYMQCVGMLVFIDTEFKNEKCDRKKELSYGVDRAVYEIMFHHLIYIVSSLREEDLQVIKKISEKGGTEKTRNDAQLSRLQAIGLLDEKDGTYYVANNLLKNFLLGMPKEGILEKIRKTSDRNPEWTDFAKATIRKSIDETIKVAVGALS